VSEPLELTVPGSDSRAARRHLGAALAKLVRDLQRVALPADPDLAADARAVLALLGPLSRRQPGPLWSALRRPSVYSHLRLAADGTEQPLGAGHLLHAGLVTLAAELASTSALEEAIDFRRAPTQLLLRSRLEQIVVRPGLALRLAPDGAATQDGRACERRAAFVPVAGSTALALADDNPLASLEAHPDKHGSQIDLGEAPSERWVEALRDALRRIADGLPLLAAELDLVLSVFVPVGTHAEKHLSASYREALGVVYVSLHPDPLTMTEAVVHEAQHNKLNAVLSVDPLLENHPAERYRSPVRPDPRPLLGVLLAVHAFVPVALLYRALRHAGDPLVSSARADARLDAILRGNAEGLEMLERHARPTPAGAELLKELRHWHDRSSVPPSG
jgi:HEXXH motif-containing protein